MFLFLIQDGKNLTMLVTEVCIMSIMSSVLLASDEKITDKKLEVILKLLLLLSYVLILKYIF